MIYVWYGLIKELTIAERDCRAAALRALALSSSPTSWAISHNLGTSPSKLNWYVPSTWNVKTRSPIMGYAYINWMLLMDNGIQPIGIPDWQQNQTRFHTQWCAFHPASFGLKECVQCLIGYLQTVACINKITIVILTTKRNNKVLIKHRLLSLGCY